ncbi:PEP-CTERM sorting domain-containing protein [Tautonia sociabilis]|uniref:PEP-CTERM sorting domain-containing protein n=1 Tax=Tautonia sociabilis TaxID=2080755 RepID=A0A432MJU5_9BACT|nr:PEP-CTERM sorting domain-containing protein [Tautonia sociabilis]RUL87684.1 PEP-CTERM sorting domain-containing protein [Tautonia sociabilis]
MGTLKRGRPGRLSLALMIAGIGMGIATDNRARASAIEPKVEQRAVYYSTSGTIGTPGDGSAEFIGFEGIGGSWSSSAPAGVFYAPGVFSLGAFQVSGLSPGKAREFDALPFSITLNVFGDPYAGQAISRIRIDGVLDGELSNTPGRGLLASVKSVSQIGSPIGTPPFRLEDLQILAPQFLLPAGSMPSRLNPIYGYVGSAVPEPTALVTLGLGAAVVAWRSIRRSRRPARPPVSAG